MSDAEREKQAAVAALVWRLRNRSGEDDEPFAAEYVASLWARGWRPVIEQGPDWRLRTGGSPPSEEYLAAKQRVLALAGGQQAPETAVPDGAARTPDPAGTETPAVTITAGSDNGD